MWKMVIVKSRSGIIGQWPYVVGVAKVEVGE